MPSSEHSALARQYQKVQEVEAQAKKLWDQKDRELRKLVRLAKIGRKTKAVLPISENRGIEITNRFKGEDKVFTPAFCHRWQVKEVALQAD